jgi:hypothetical protein
MASVPCHQALTAAAHKVLKPEFHLIILQGTGRYQAALLTHTAPLARDSLA